MRPQRHCLPEGTGTEEENPTRRVKIVISVDLVADVTVEMVASVKMDVAKSLANVDVDPRVVRAESQIPRDVTTGSAASGLAAT